MDNPNYFGNRHDERLGVNKIGKHIRKSPPYFANPAAQPPDFTNPARQPPYPQVYTINKNDFRNTVQRLTGSPSHHHHAPKRNRPTQLAPINVYRPQMPVPPPRPAAQYGQPPPMTSGDHNAAESPISAYMRYLQHSVLDPSQTQPPPLVPSPVTNRPLNPHPSPTSQFLLPSPSGYLNLLSPLSSYPLLSPRYRFPPPTTPDFSFSPVGQSGMLGPRPPPPPSPGMGFPSPGFFQFSSPRWSN